MDNLKKLSDDLGNKAKIGAAAIGTKVQPLKEKAEAAIAGAMNKTKDSGEAGKPSGISEILRKAKEKVMGSKSSDATMEERASASGDETSTAPTNKELEDIKDDVESIVSEIESTSDENPNNKEKIQKLLLPLLTKLKVAQDKFQAMLEERQKRKIEAAAEAGTEGPGSPVKNILVQAEAAARMAFENAEKVARKVAQKAGIFDDGKEAASNAEENEAATTTEAAAPAETEQATETKTEQATETKTEEAAADGETKS
jgi:hypothetical protein